MIESYCRNGHLVLLCFSYFLKTVLKLFDSTEWTKQYRIYYLSSIYTTNNWKWKRDMLKALNSNTFSLEVLFLRTVFTIFLSTKLSVGIQSRPESSWISLSRPDLLNRNSRRKVRQLLPRLAETSNLVYNWTLIR